MGDQAEDSDGPQVFLHEILHIFIRQGRDRAGMRYDAVQKAAGEMVDVIERHLRSVHDGMSLALFTFNVYQDLRQQGYGMPPLGMAWTPSR